MPFQLPFATAGERFAENTLVVQLDQLHGYSNDLILCPDKNTIFTVLSLD
jgi:hypothetical protein